MTIILLFRILYLTARQKESVRGKQENTPLSFLSGSPSCHPESAEGSFSSYIVSVGDETNETWWRSFSWECTAESAQSYWLLIISHQSCIVTPALLLDVLHPLHDKLHTAHFLSSTKVKVQTASYKNNFVHRYILKMLKPTFSSRKQQARKN